MRFFIFILFLQLSHLQLCQDQHTTIQPITNYQDLLSNHNPNQLTLLFVFHQYQNFTDILPLNASLHAKLLQLNCSDLNSSDYSHFPYCKPQYQYKLPAIIYYDHNFIEHRAKGSLTQTDISNQLDQYYPNYALQIDSKESYADWLTKTKAYQIKAIYYYNSQPPLWWKQITIKFHQKCSLAQTNLKFRQKEFEGMVFIKNGNEYEYDSNQKFNVIAKLFQSQLNQAQQDFKPFSLINIQIEKRHYSQLEHAIQTNQWIAIHYRRNSIQPFKNFDQFYDTFKGFIKFIEIDCSEFDCRVKQCPALHIYSYGQKTNPLYIVEEDDSTNKIVEELLDLMPGNPLVQYQQNQVHSVMQKCLDEGKYLIIWAYEEQQLLQTFIGATMSLEYSSNFKFMFFKDPDERLRQQLKIDKLPKIIAFGEVNLESGQNKMFEFSNELNHFNLVRWIEMIKEKQERNVIEVQNQEQFDRICYKQCMIVAVEEKSELQKVKVESGLPWIWIDIKCQKFVKRTLKLKEVPSLIFYDKKKLRVGVTDIHMNNVISYWQNNKKKLQRLNDELELQNCNNKKQDL